MNPSTSRRGFLALAAGSTLSRAPSPEPRPSGFTTVDDATGRRLDALWGAVRASWPACDLARHAFNAARDDEDVPLEVAHRLLYPHSHADRVRNRALTELGLAVLEAAGTAKPDEDRWERFGVPLAVVRVGARLFVVHAGDQAEWHDDPEDWGCLDTIVIDL